MLSVGCKVYIAVPLVIKDTAVKHLQKYLKQGKRCQSVKSSGAFQRGSLICANVGQVVLGKVRLDATQIFQNTVALTFRYCQPQKLDPGELISVVQNINK